MAGDVRRLDQRQLAVSRAGSGPAPQNVFINPIIIITPGKGVFVYSPAPGANNLVASIASSAGIDPYGNRFVAGHASYALFGGSYFAASLTSGGVLFYIGGATEAAPYTNVAQLGLTQIGTEVVTQLNSTAWALAHGATKLQFWLSPSGDTTGATDTVAINAALTVGQNVYLLPGTFYLNAPLNVSAFGQTLDLGGATVQPGSGWAGGELINLIGSQSRIRDGRLYGGTTTRSANPAQDGILITATAVDVWIESLFIDYVNGWAVNTANLTAPAIGTIQGLAGHNDAGGIRIAAASGQSAQVNISDVSLQSLEVNEALRLVNVFDVLVSNFNASVMGTAGVPTVHLLGQVSTCHFTNMDCGVVGTGTAGVGVLQVDDSGGNSPQDCSFSGGTFQAGGHGILVTGGASRIRWHGVMSFGNQGDGWKFTGTGTALAVIGCMANFNNQAAGVAYDVEVTATAHVGLDFFTYASGAVTNSLIVGAGNHVSNINSTNPGGAAVAGAPGGW